MPTAFYFTKTSPAISNSQAHSTIRKGSDAVGYHSITLYPGWNMVSVNLANMSDKDGYTLDEIFPGRTPGLVANAQETLADYVQIWEKENHKYADKNYHLYVSRNANQPDKDYTWRYNANDPAPDNLAEMGCGLWYFHRGDTPITLKLTPPYSL